MFLVVGISMIIDLVCWVWNLTVSNGKLFCSGCREELAVK